MMINVFLLIYEKIYYLKYEHYKYK